MENRVHAIYYDGATGRPQDAWVRVSEMNTLEVELPDGPGFQWPLEHRGMTWERSSSMLRLSFGEHPRRVLLIQDGLFIKSFAVRMRAAGRSGAHDRALAIARSGPVLFIAAVVLLFIGAYVWLLPWAAERLAVLVPDAVEERIGEALFGGMVQDMSVDSARSAVLREYASHLRLTTGPAPTYHVVRDEQVNAFAIPGGHIVVFTGILDRMDSSDQLAALLAHEATHVEERHSTRMMARSLAGYLFLSLLIGDANAVIAIVAENANAVRNLGYGRGLENEADRIGQQRMLESGVDPMGMVRLLELLEREGGDMPEQLAFLSSHPLTKERLDNARKWAAELGVPAGRDPAVEALFAKLAGTAQAPATMPSSRN